MSEVRYRETERRLWASVGTTPTERRLELSRLGVTVRVQVVGDGPPVVFVHGASNGGTSWAPLAARLPAFRCVLLDRPGCGLSEPLADRLDGDGLRAVAQALVVDVLDALEITSAHMVATSYGGLAALHGAAAHPGQIGRVVQLGWPVGAPLARVPMVMRMAALRPVGRLMAALPPTGRSVRWMQRQVGLRRAIDTGRFGQAELAWFLALLRDTDTFRNEVDSGRYLSLRHGLLGALVIPTEVLASIRTPTRFLWGEDDPFGGAEVAEQLVARIPGAQLELVAGAGHAVWIDDPDRTATSVTAFLGQPDDAAGPSVWPPSQKEV